MLTKRKIEWAMYAAFVALIMVAPLVMDSFWLNRVAKYLVYGMLGVAVALSWGYAGILNLGQGLFFGFWALIPDVVEHGGRPGAPRMAVQCTFAVGREKVDELATLRRGEARDLNSGEAGDPPMRPSLPSRRG